MAKKQDRRVQRTQQLLREALISLIRERGFETLSVQDIIDRANVGRATFYAHFDNKEDLLVSGLDGLRSSLKQRQHERLSGGGAWEERVFGFSEELFAHVNEFREVFRAMVGKRSGAMVQHLVYKLLIDLIRDDIKATVAEGPPDSVSRETLAQFIAGGLFGLLTWWLAGQMRLSVAQLNKIFRRLAIPALKTEVP